MSGPGPLVRPARPGDAAAMSRVNGDAWRAAYRGIFPDEVLEKRGREPDAEARRVRWIATPGLSSLVAEEEGEVVGFVVAGNPRDPIAGFDAEVLAIYVHPSRQGRGHGSLLLREAASVLAARGLRTFFLWTLRDLPPTRAFYEANGGRAAGERTAVVAGVSVAEVAYGWKPLDSLLGPDRATPPGV